MNNDSENQWLENILDSLEAKETIYPLENVEPLGEETEISKEVIQKYFTSHVYPYNTRLDLRTYYQQKIALQIELVKLHNWIQDTEQKLILVFEGRDAAGKGSTIKRFMEHLNPRKARVVALEKPTTEESGQWYFQRYIQRFPSEGEIVFFDRSWYNRAGVERVMGFCNYDEYLEFLDQAPTFERMISRSGIKLIKFYMSVSRSEQARRFEERKTNLLKQWKLSPIDMEAQQKWDDYTEAKNRIFERTDSKEAPWIIVKSEDKMRARIETMRYVLSQFDYPDKNNSLVEKIDPLIVTPASNLLDIYGRSQIVD